MAIVTETYEINGRQFVRTYSNTNRYVVGGEPYGAYTEANDPADANRTYVEGPYSVQVAAFASWFTMVWPLAGSSLV